MVKKDLTGIKSVQATVIRTLFMRHMQTSFVYSINKPENVRAYDGSGQYTTRNLEPV